VVFVERRFEPDFLTAASGAGAALAPSTRVTGFNINGGRRVDLGVYVVKP
jgi:hypothetical protein